jgi:processive 1,2-diacylglycerol beta-glucosyltransferase
MSKPTILFLYMVPQTGHQKAAEAVIEAASQMDPRVECIGIEAVNHTYPIIGTVMNRVYLGMLKRAPFIWEYLYDNPEVESATRDARGLLALMGSFRFKKMLKKFHPSAIVCTQAVPAIAMATAKKHGMHKLPLIGVVTDFGVHSYWIHPEIDLYLVGHEDVKRELIGRGVAESRIRVTGIPIRPRFGETMDVLEARRRLRLSPNKPTLLLMGGSHGLGQIDELVAALKAIPFDHQSIVVCGKNRALYKKLSQAAQGLPDFRLYGYFRDSALLMSAADVLVTKPGGLTCSEALAKGLPLILTNPIPGQEERNVRFLTRHQVARVARDTDELIHAVSDLLRHPKKIRQMRQRARMVAKPFSAWEAARLIFDAMNRRAAFAAIRPAL